MISGSVPTFRERTTNDEQSVLNSMSATWTPSAWWNTHGDIGYQTSTRETRTLLRRGDCDASVFACADLSLGRLAASSTSPTEATVNIINTVQLPARYGIRFRPSLGANYVRGTNSSTGYSASNLALGATTSAGAGTTTLNPETQSTLVQLGLFATTGISLFNDRLSTSIGTRIDASNSLGKSVRPTYPKLDLSYVLSNEPFFPWRDVVNMLRLRLAYGHAAVQPDLGASYRTYNLYGSPQPGTLPAVVITTLGNPGLRPERTTELETGFDLGVLGDRVTLGVTGYRKLSRDALVSISLPPSVSAGTGGYTANIGSVRNTGAEISLGAFILDRPEFTWNVNVTYSRNRNTLVKLSDDASTQDISNGAAGSNYQSRYVEGYPLAGTWTRPVVSYSDTNRDGVITDDEIVRGDSTVFVGGPLPKYEASFGTQAGFLHGRLTIATQFAYQNGMSQVNQTVFDVSGLAGGALRAYNDPSTSLAEQAAIRSGIAALHTVSILRMQSLSVRMAAPQSLARRLRASAMSVAIQGNNLALWTNYSGSDPNVSSSIVGNVSIDAGVIPQPRTWGLNVSLNY